MKGIGENLGRGDGMISLPPIVMAYLNMFFDINRTALLLLYIEDFNPGVGLGEISSIGTWTLFSYFDLFLYRLM